jgi:hypothetical protein
MLNGRKEWVIERRRTDFLATRVDHCQDWTETGRIDVIRRVSLPGGDDDG